MTERKGNPLDDYNPEDPFGFGAELVELDAALESTPLGSLISGPSEAEIRARKDALIRGGVKRWPEYTGDLADRATLLEADGAKFPETNEERFAYVVYRSGDIRHDDSYALATDGFLFDRFRGAYIPVPVAKRMIEILDSYDGVTGSIDEWLKIMNSDFLPKHLPKDIKVLARNHGSVGNRFVQQLHPDTRTQLWGAYVGRFSSLVEQSYEDISAS